MELLNLKKTLEEKEKGIQEMADKLSITKEELLSKAREVLELYTRINNSKEHTSSSSELDEKPNVRKTRSMGTPPSELDSKVNARRARSMGVPPIMGVESPSEVMSASPAVPELRLVLLGKREEDKRLVAEAIVGKEIGVPLVSSSRQIQWSERKQADDTEKKVTVVDTPDWFSPEFSQRLRKDVRLCMEISSPGPHVFLLVIPVDTLEGKDGNIPDKMEDIFGETCWEYTIILFTSAKGTGQTRMEEFIQKNKEIQQLVERCENKYQFLDLSACEAKASLLKAVIEGNGHKFYNSQMYLEADSQFREMEAKMHQEKEQRKEKRKRTEEEMKQQHDGSLQESLRKVKEKMKPHECEIQVLNDKMSALEREIREEQDEGKIRERQRQLEREAVKKKAVEKRMTMLRQSSEEERKEMEAKHKAEMEELRETYKREARVEKERYIMRMVLSRFHRVSSSMSLMTKKLLPFLQPEL